MNVEKVFRVLRYPVSFDETSEGIKTVVTGGVLSSLSLLFVPQLAVFGYFIDVLDAVRHGDDRPPAFPGWTQRSEWLRLVKNGFKYSIILYIYAANPLLVFTVLGGVSLPPVPTLGTGVAFIDFAIYYVLFSLVKLLELLQGFSWVPVYLFYSVLIGYFFWGSVANFSRTKRLVKAFSISDLKPILLDWTYFRRWFPVYLVYIIPYTVLWALATSYYLSHTGDLFYLPVAPQETVVTQAAPSVAEQKPWVLKPWSLSFVVHTCLNFVAFYVTVAYVYFLSSLWTDFRRKRPRERFQRDAKKRADPAKRRGKRQGHRDE